MVFFVCMVNPLMGKESHRPFQELDPRATDFFIHSIHSACAGGCDLRTTQPRAIIREEAELGTLRPRSRQNTTKQGGLRLWVSRSRHNVHSAERTGGGWVVRSAAFGFGGCRWGRVSGLRSFEAAPSNSYGGNPCPWDTFFREASPFREVVDQRHWQPFTGTDSKDFSCHLFWELDLAFCFVAFIFHF